MAARLLSGKERLSRSSFIQGASSADTEARTCGSITPSASGSISETSSSRAATAVLPSSSTPPSQSSVTGSMR